MGVTIADWSPSGTLSSVGVLRRTILSTALWSAHGGIGVVVAPMMSLVLALLSLGRFGGLVLDRAAF